MLDTWNMLVPKEWSGRPSQLDNQWAHNHYVQWLKNFPDTWYLALWQGWTSVLGTGSPDLPLGCDGYVVSFHLEAVDVEWVTRQAKRVQAPIIVLSDSEYYNWPYDNNVYPFTYIFWHLQIKKMLEWFPNPGQDTKRQYLTSAFCNRITQSKLLVFTAIAEYIGTDQCLLKLSNWIEGENVHDREPTGNEMLDSLANTFWDKYAGIPLDVGDGYTEDKNYQQYTADPWTAPYQQAAIHFTNESFHYSYMDNEQGKFIWPGPFITEKTLKCLVGGTGFVPVGQYDTYGRLSRLGFRFDYKFDTSWDSDPGNITRLVSIVNLIKQFSQYSIQDLVDATRESSRHNQDYIMSGEFAQRAQTENIAVIDTICRLFIT
jgi:hypothetical protein